MKKYNYIVIGAGSAGIASARWVAKKFNKKVAVIEHKKLGGTCVNVGCMPKKVTYNVAHFMDLFKQMELHGVKKNDVNFSYNILKKNRDAYISRLNGIYNNLLKNSNVDFYKGFGSFVDKDKVKVGD